jgi:hypothetical protein
MGLIRCTTGVGKEAIRQLKNHLNREKAAVRGSDIGLRSFLLGDFHVCLAECLGNSLLADTLRDFTARTTLIAMLYQSSHDAAQSCSEHVRIVQALEQGNLVLAENLMQAHIASVQATLKLQPASGDALARLRSALSPLSYPASAPMESPTAHKLPVRHLKPRRLGAALFSDPDSPDSTYLGALL